jgi:TolB-like protein/class 3 adenylate cyclase/Tfp pilus assembly protein PilF
MIAEVEFGPDVEIAHVLCIDVVGYSKLATNEQSTFLRQLNEIVRNTPSFRRAEAAGKLLRLPTGDGMVLVFFSNPQAPVQCALEISRALQERGGIGVRMGVHSGPVDRVSGIDERSNLAGTGINVAQRVMDCGDAGHILLSKRVAEDLGQYTQWQPHLHCLGECEVKHGVKVQLYSVYTCDIGNSNVPEKVRRDQRRRIQAGRQRRKLAFIVLLAVALLALTGGWLWQRMTRGTLGRSIAVLPFENLSAEKENGYFAGGIQDEILTNLAKIGDLKIISRSSVMAYANKRPNIRDIAKALGVATVVEGSVQRVANRVRINVQLINAATDQQIWAENYEKDVSDIFAAQRDVAFEIASSLHAQLSPAEKARLERRPTSNGAAYLLYLQAQDVWTRAQSIEEIEKMAQLYQKAIELDSAFALAFAQLAYMEALIYYSRGTSLPLERGRAAANEALRLQPDLPEGHFALGYIYLWANHDYERALAQFDIAKRGMPNNADIVSAVAAIQRKQGKWAESINSYEKAAVLNPKDATIWSMGLAANYSALREYSSAAKMLDRAIATDSSFFHSHIWRAWLDIDSNGDTRAMEELLAKTPENIDPDGVVTFARYELKMFQRKYDEALAVLEKSTAECIENLRAAPGADCSKSLLQAVTYWLKKDSAKADLYFEQARAPLERKITDNPTLGAAHASLGQIYAGLRRRDDALREASRALELAPESRDALHGPHVTLAVAQIYAMINDADAALPLLEHLLSAPNGITPWLLKLDPVWDPVRSDPRFQKILTAK